MRRASRLYSCWATIGPRCADVVGDADDFADLPGREVGDAECADLALGDQLGDGGQRLVEGRSAVGLVQVEQVDVVGAEPRRLASTLSRRPFGDSGELPPASPV